MPPPPRRPRPDPLHLMPAPPPRGRAESVASDLSEDTPRASLNVVSMTSSEGSDRNLEIKVRSGRPRRGSVAKTSKVRTVAGFVSNTLIAGDGRGAALRVVDDARVAGGIAADGRAALHVIDDARVAGGIAANGMNIYYARPRRRVAGKTPMITPTTIRHPMLSSYDTGESCS